MKTDTDPREEQLREQARTTPEGRLLVRYGFEPWDTESAARIVARKAAEDIKELVAALEELAMLADFTHPTERAAWLKARNAIAKATGGALAGGLARKLSNTTSEATKHGLRPHMLPMREK